jgi:hypothetical protein
MDGYKSTRHYLDETDCSARPLASCGDEALGIALLTLVRLSCPIVGQRVETPH